MIDLSIVIVNWNTRQLLQQCLQSIYQHAGAVALEVIVVDNASSDGSAQMVTEQFPKVQLIANSGNAGYVRANNQGIAASTGRHVLLLNADTIIRPRVLSGMVAVMNSQPRLGILGPQLRNPDDSIQQSVRRFPRLIDNIIILTKLHNFWPRLLHRYLCHDFDYTAAASVDQVMGAAMLIRRDVLEQIGPLDSGLWSWYEDVDYCYRAKAAGWQVGFWPGGQIMHYKGQSFAQQLPLKKQRWLTRSMSYYTRKHLGLSAWLILQPFVLISYVLASAVQGLGIQKRNKEL